MAPIRRRRFYKNSSQRSFSLKIGIGMGWGARQKRSDCSRRKPNLTSDQICKRGGQQNLSLKIKVSSLNDYN